MPKAEKVTPSRPTRSAGRERYPRKNIYFVGHQMEEVYNFCIWEVHCMGYTTLEYKRARGMSQYIVDILTQRYLNAMEDPRTMQGFTEWSIAQDLPAPAPFLLAFRKMLRWDFTKSDIQAVAATMSPKERVEVGRALERLLRSARVTDK